MTKFERDKVYKTRDGKSVRVLCTDAPGAHPIIGIYVDRDDEFLGVCAPRHASGRAFAWKDDRLDLMLPKPERVVEWGRSEDGVSFVRFGGGEGDVIFRVPRR